MTFKELFEVGQTFENYIEVATQSERDRIPKNHSRIELPMDLIEEIKEVKEEIYILASGEMWCPDCQLNITVAKKLTEINDNIKLSIISMGRGRTYLMPLLNLEEFKIPTMVILDKNFNQLGLFLERPKNTKKLEENAENELFYLKGNFLTDAARELILLMKG
ncbi:thioredoxin family protein [Fusobacteria bacterium ZRK30]|nr:thioredoxin family protein [Fusobacteria bacterium ZRK30]